MDKAYLINYDNNGHESYHPVYVKEIQHDGTAVVVSSVNSEMPVGVNSKRLVNITISPYIPAVS